MFQNNALECILASSHLNHGFPGPSHEVRIHKHGRRVSSQNLQSSRRLDLHCFLHPSEPELDVRFAAGGGHVNLLCCSFGELLLEEPPSLRCLRGIAQLRFLGHLSIRQLHLLLLDDVLNGLKKLWINAQSPLYHLAVILQHLQLLVEPLWRVSVLRLAGLDRAVLTLPCDEDAVQHFLLLRRQGIHDLGNLVFLLALHRLELPINLHHSPSHRRDILDEELGQAVVILVILGPANVPLAQSTCVRADANERRMKGKEAKREGQDKKSW
mmetsp:Transcript_136117/g.322629  ORF Transcript_136117/g.322629 Transcript_136117/m.322629 type:complete len:269 (-) Transcript_136117:70-876(-)